MFFVSAVTAVCITADSYLRLLCGLFDSFVYNSQCIACVYLFDFCLQWKKRKEKEKGKWQQSDVPVKQIRDLVTGNGQSPIESIQPGKYINSCIREKLWKNSELRALAVIYSCFGLVRPRQRVALTVEGVEGSRLSQKKRSVVKMLHSWYVAEKW